MSGTAKTPEHPMRLYRLRVDNFKSLVDFDLHLAPLTCLIGLNGAGKSTVLQAIDFASQLFRGDVDDWLEQRKWKAADLNSKLIGRSNIRIELWLSRRDARYHWWGNFNRAKLRCTQESLSINGETRFSVYKEYYDFHFEKPTPGRVSLDQGTRIDFQYTGSVLSQLNPEVVPEEIWPVAEFMWNVASLEALAPQHLRRRAERSKGTVGLGGEYLSAFVDELSSAQRTALFSRIKECYPELEAIITRSLRRGWKQLAIRERYGEKRLTTEAQHVNDGMLRLLAIFAELLTESEFLLFDEIENGINPDLVEFLLDVLVNARQQVLVTTHSPMILNYLEDEVARAGVQYLYRTPEGYTRSVPFFDIPSVSEKLHVMGLGEAFVDTDLTRLQEEIRNMPAREKETGDAAID